MSKALPNINETVEVMIEDGGERTRSSSRIYDTSKGLIQLFWPTREGVRVPVARDGRITLVYHRESGIYECPGVVAEISQDPVPIIHIRPQGKIDRIQRREYVRVKASIPVLMHEAQAAAERSRSSETAVFRISARTVDLSGGGMCILKELSVPIGSVFQVRLMLEEDDPPLELVARIVSVVRTQDAYGRNLFRMGIEFTGIPDAKRKIIVRKVFKIQQESAARSMEDPGDSPHYETNK